MTHGITAPWGLERTHLPRIVNGDHAMGVGVDVIQRRDGVAGCSV